MSYFRGNFSVKFFLLFDLNFSILFLQNVIWKYLLNSTDEKLNYQKKFYLFLELILTDFDIWFVYKFKNPKFQSIDDSWMYWYWRDSLLEWQCSGLCFIRSSKSLTNRMCCARAESACLLSSRLSRFFEKYFLDNIANFPKSKIARKTTISFTNLDGRAILHNINFPAFFVMIAE